MRQGNSHILVIVLVLVGLIVAASAGSYYLLKSQDKAPIVHIDKPMPTVNPVSKTNTTSQVSENDDISTLETELDGTSTGSFDSDIEELNNSASSL